MGFLETEFAHYNFFKKKSFGNFCLLNSCNLQNYFLKIFSFLILKKNEPWAVRSRGFFKFVQNYHFEKPRQGLGLAKQTSQGVPPRTYQFLGTTNFLPLGPSCLPLHPQPAHLVLTFCTGLKTDPNSIVSPRAPPQASKKLKNEKNLLWARAHPLPLAPVAYPCTPHLLT